MLHPVYLPTTSSYHGSGIPPVLGLGSVLFLVCLIFPLELPSLTPFHRTPPGGTDGYRRGPERKATFRDDIMRRVFFDIVQHHPLRSLGSMQPKPRQLYYVVRLAFSRRG